MKFSGLTAWSVAFATLAAVCLTLREDARGQTAVTPRVRIADVDGLQAALDALEAGGGAQLDRIQDASETVYVDADDTEGAVTIQFDGPSGSVQASLATRSSKPAFSLPEGGAIYVGDNGVAIYEDTTNNGWIFTAGGSVIAHISLAEGVRVFDPLAFQGSGAGLTDVDAATVDGYNGHAAVTLGSDADAFLGLSGQAISVDAQSGNKVLASPANGSSGDMAPRALVSADLPDLSASYLPLTAGVVAQDIELSASKAVKSGGLSVTWNSAGAASGVNLAVAGLGSAGGLLLDGPTRAVNFRRNDPLNSAVLWLDCAGRVVNLNSTSVPVVGIGGDTAGLVAFPTPETTLFQMAIPERFVTIKKIAISGLYKGDGDSNATYCSIYPKVRNQVTGAFTVGSYIDTIGSAATVANTYVWMTWTATMSPALTLTDGQTLQVKFGQFNDAGLGAPVAVHVGAIGIYY